MHPVLSSVHIALESKYYAKGYAKGLANFSNNFE